MFGRSRRNAIESAEAESGDDSPDCSTASSPSTFPPGIPLGQRICRPKMEVARAAELRARHLQSSSSSEPSGLTRILPFLFLGSQHDALDQDCLQRHQIEFVVNLSVGGPKPDFIDEANFLRIPVNDTQAEKLLPHFDRAFEFLDRVEKSNSCALVHCLAGISRSPTLAIAFVMRHLGMRSDEAYRFVKAKRPVISPNFNFLGQLLEFESSLKRSGVRKRDNTDADCPAADQVSPSIRPQSDNFCSLKHSTDPVEAFQAKNMRRSFSAPLKVQRITDRSALRIDLQSGRNRRREMVDGLESLSLCTAGQSTSAERPKANTVPLAQPQRLSLISSELPVVSCAEQQSSSVHPCCSNCLQVEVDSGAEASHTSVANWTLTESFERQISSPAAGDPRKSVDRRSPSPHLRCIPHATSVENPLFRTAVFRSSLKRLRAAQVSPGSAQPCRDGRAATEGPAATSGTQRGAKSLKRASWPRGTMSTSTCVGGTALSPIKSPDDGFSDGQYGAAGYGDPHVKDWGSTGSLEIVVS